jgi:uncharacterized protein (TIGR03437 family)
MKSIIILFLLALAAAQAQTVTTVASFDNITYTNPNSLIQGADGNFYGATAGNGNGTIFEMTPAGALTTLYTFPPFGIFSIGASGLVQGRDGNFYGTTDNGGGSTCEYYTNFNVGCGTIFTVRPDGSGTTLYRFGGAMNGGQPNPNLIQATDGNFYGTTYWGGVGCGVGQGVGGCGTIFQITPGGQLTTIYRFGASTTGGGTPPDGTNPIGGLIQGSDGYLYGTTEYGGNSVPYHCTALASGDLTAGCGTIFKVTTGGSLTTLYTFNGPPDAANPTASLIQGTDGNFYGTGAAGGTVSPTDGTFFKMTPAGAETVLYSFGSSAKDALNPTGNLVQASDGNFYGTAGGGANHDGALYKVTPSGAESVVYSFDTTPTVGNILVGLTLGSDGNVYGVDPSGGANGLGTVFRLAIVAPNTPAIAASGGVLNGASFQPGIAAGSWITITGTDLSAKTDTWNSVIVNGALPTTLDGVSVMVGGEAAYIEYISATQINALAPSVPAGTVPVTVTNASGTSQAAMAQLTAEQPAFFQWGNYAVATRQNFSLAVKNGTFAGTTTVPAAPGDVIILWGTGFGPTSPSAPAGAETPSTTTYNTATAVSVTVGGKPATVYGAALAPGYAGLYQIAIQIPAPLANGDYPVVATISGAQSPSTTMITVQQ